MRGGLSEVFSRVRVLAQWAAYTETWQFVRHSVFIHYVSYNIFIYVYSLRWSKLHGICREVISSIALQEGKRMILQDP